MKTIAFRRGIVVAGLLGILAVLAGCAPAGGLLSGGATLPDNPGIGSSDGCLPPQDDGEGQADGACDDAAAPAEDGVAAGDEGNGSVGTIGITIHATFDWVVEARLRRIYLPDSSCPSRLLDDAVGRDSRGVVAGTIRLEVMDGCRGVVAFVADVREQDGSSYTWVVILQVDSSSVSLQCGSFNQSGGCAAATAADQGPSDGLEHRYEFTTTISPFYR